MRLTIGEYLTSLKAVITRKDIYGEKITTVEAKDDYCDGVIHTEKTDFLKDGRVFRYTKSQLVNPSQRVGRRRYDKDGIYRDTDHANLFYVSPYAWRQFFDLIHAIAFAVCVGIAFYLMIK